MRASCTAGFACALIIGIVCVTNLDSARAQGRADAGLNAMHARARAVEPVMRDAAQRYEVDPRALWTIAYLETRFRAGLVSPKGARGMMQFMPATSVRFGLANPHDTTAAIDAAARYVRFLAARFGNRFDLVLAGYNAGEGAVEAYLRGVTLRTSDGRVINPNRVRTGGVPPYAETRNYVARGLYVARALTSANIFPLAKLPTTNGRLTLPADESQSSPDLNFVPGETATLIMPEIVTPTSLYAFNEQRRNESVREQTSRAEDSNENSTSPTTPRSFRAAQRR